MVGVDAISVLFPQARPLIDFELAETKGQVKIVFWNPSLGTQPTQTELDAVTDTKVKAAKDAKEAIDKPERNELRKSLTDDITKCDEIIALTSVNLTQALNRLQQMARINKRILRYLRKTIE